jgi:hypothetical protein
VKRIVFVLLVAAAACGGGHTASPTTTTTTTTTTTAPARPKADRVKDCEDAINAASANVKALLTSAPTAVLTEGSPAAAATKIRSDAAATSEIVENARQKCATELPECPTVADKYAQYLNANIDSVKSIADIALGGSPPSTTAPVSPELTC